MTNITFFKKILLSVICQKASTSRLRTKTPFYYNQLKLQEVCSYFASRQSKTPRVGGFCLIN